MSGIGHAVSKVFSGIGSIIKKVWKPLVIAAAVYFTGGLALGAMGAVGADAAVDLGGAGVLDATTAAGADALAGGAAGGLGAGISGGIAAGGADAIAAGTAGDLGLGAADAAATGGFDATLAGTGAADASSGAFDTAAGTGSYSAAGGPTDGGFNATTAGTGVGQPGMGGSPTTASMPGGMTANLPGDAGSGLGDGTQPSSLWQNSLNTAGSILKTPGVPTLLGGLMQGYMQQQNMNAYLQYQEAHAPGQVAGGVPTNMFSGMSNNKNLSPQTPKPTANSLPQFASLAQPGSTPQGVPSMPGQNQAAATAPYPGYGTPGYGQQPGILGQQTPFIESPYDESYAG